MAQKIAHAESIELALEPMFFKKFSTWNMKKQDHFCENKHEYLIV